MYSSSVRSFHYYFSPPLSMYLLISSSWQRGKFFPQLTNLVRINTPKAVQTESRKSFRKLPGALEQAVATLTNLKGVGTTLASGTNHTAKEKASCPSFLPSSSSFPPFRKENTYA